MASATRRLPPGTAVGRYSVERFIGAGGMADVYAARDQHLGRIVALKILQRARSSDPERVQRFAREAQLASALNHPSIVSVHDAGSADLPDGETVHYLAMELIDGRPLGEWARSNRSLVAKLELLAAVAEGLARAHAGGIIHRDLKPDNIMVVGGAHPKIVDFGIAKLTERDGGFAFHESTAPTAAFGTAAYMSPEQVEGLELDHRSDVFSFGCVMYELLGGRPAFRRETAVETMHAILHDPPAPLAGLPAELQRIIRKCLARNREERYQAILDAAIDLRELARDAAMHPASRARRLAGRAALTALGIAAIAAVILFRRDMVGGAAVAGQAAHHAPIMLRMTNSGNVINGAISPDGNYIVHSTPERENATMWVKQVATGTNVRVLPPAPVHYLQTVVSGDSNYIFYSLASRSEPNIVDVMQVPLLGGQPRKVAADIDSHFAVSPDGARLAFIRFNAFEREFRMTIADLESGAERVIMRRQSPEGAGRPWWSPDGQKIVFVGAAGGRYSGPPLPETTKRRVQHSAIFEIDVASGAVQQIGTSEWKNLGSVVWMPDDSGFLVTASDGRQAPQIWLLPPDGDSSKARKITSDLSVYSSITVTADGKSIAANRIDGTANIFVVDLDRPRRARPLTVGLGNRYGLGGVRWAPGGTILFTEFSGTSTSLNFIDAEGGDTRKLLRGAYWGPIVSPDGRTLAFLSDRSGTIELWTSDLDGGNLRQITNSGSATAPSWCADGKSLVYVTTGRVQAAWKVSATGGDPVRVTSQPTNSTVVSPDGKSILCRLRSVDPATPLWRTAIVPLDGIGEPRYFEVPRFGGPPKAQWLPDGRGFLFLDFADGIANLWMQSLDAGEPRQITSFDAGFIEAYDISPDGRRIAMSRGERVNDIVLIRDFR
ncbi:MAG TPA: LpqB family beta-propeller domain-containing protein [Thermoanaerobaculia bacterium]|nr:LpqB family beta-propeller domain-containing protein [Thermoanaerobaculia bacterium]